MSNKIKNVQVDNHSFNADYYEGWKEADFIKDQFAAVPDSYGSDEQKKEFLKQAFAKINPEAATKEKK